MNPKDKEYILSRISTMLDTEWFKARIENWEMVAFSIGKFDDETFDDAIDEYNNYLNSYEKN